MKPFRRFLALAFTWLLLAPPLSAVDAPPKQLTGQKILYYDRGADKWEPGTFVGETPGGSQPIIRRKPSEFYPEGDQTAYAWADIKADAPGDKPAPPTPKPGSTRPAPPAPKPNTTKPAPRGKTGKTPNATGGAPLTEEEILSFLQQRLGDNPFADSARLQETKNDLGALIKKRGTAFRHTSAVSDFGQKISAFGMTSEVTGPLAHNFGPPNTQDWLFGSWVTSKTGLPVKYVEGDKIITWLKIGAANTGTVTLKKDGTYRWDTDSAQGVIEGKWHVASLEESGDHGGAGLVLEKAKNGENWHAFQYRAGNPGEEWLGLAEVNHRSVREGAMRVPEE